MSARFSTEVKSCNRVDFRMREVANMAMTGSPNQIEWAEQIKPRVDAEFDRVAHAFAAVAGSQGEPLRSDTYTVIAILEEKRAEVMRKDQAGYFIRHWQELTDQVRQLIRSDSRYQAIRARQAARP
jgi:hypothetical protein